MRRLSESEKLAAQGVTNVVTMGTGESNDQNFEKRLEVRIVDEMPVVLGAGGWLAGCQHHRLIAP